MEAVTSTTFTSTSFFIFFSAIIALAVGLVVMSVFSRRNTVPSGVKHEGFQGPAMGVSNIPCGQESAEARTLADLFSNRESSTEDGVADLKELKQILSKLCCMKHDLMSPGQVVQNMMYLPYNNTHDRENPADTVARCFTKSIPPRDLDITFGTWKERALTLISRLCTSYNLSSSESDNAIRLFMQVLNDIFSIAKDVCSPPVKAPENESPRDPKGHILKFVEGLGIYTGYY